MGISLRWKWRRTSERPCSLRRRLTAGPVVATAVIEAPLSLRFFHYEAGARQRQACMQAGATECHQRDPLTPTLSPLSGGEGEMGTARSAFPPPLPPLAGEGRGEGGLHGLSTGQRDLEDEWSAGLWVLGAADYAPPAKRESEMP